MIQADRCYRNDRENHCGDAGGNHPGRKWTIDKPLHSRPAGEKGVAPESDRGQVITVNRSAGDFRNHVVGSAEPERSEPEEEQVIRVPPRYRGLQHTLHRHDEQHGLSGKVNPREPEERGQQIPLCDVDRISAPKPKHQNRPRNDERVSDEEDNGRVAGKFDPVIARAVSGQDPANPKQHPQIPEYTARNN